jgi:hypothetical protein
MLFATNAGLGALLTVRLLARLSDRIRLYDLVPLGGEVMTWPPNGDAVMIVPALVSGGGVGLSVRNSGCMCASLITGLVGREVSAGMKVRFE